MICNNSYKNQFFDRLYSQQTARNADDNDDQGDLYMYGKMDRHHSDSSWNEQAFECGANFVDCCTVIILQWI